MKSQQSRRQRFYTAWTNTTHLTHAHPLQQPIATCWITNIHHTSSLSLSALGRMVGLGFSGGYAYAGRDTGELQDLGCGSASLACTTLWVIPVRRENAA